MHGAIISVLLLFSSGAVAEDDPGALDASIDRGGTAQYSIGWYTIDSGGTTAAFGGGYTLAGTLGQPEATTRNALSGGEWLLTGGFWSRSFILRDADRLFQDRFQVLIPQM